MVGFPEKRRLRLREKQGLGVLMASHTWNCYISALYAPDSEPNDEISLPTLGDNDGAELGEREEKSSRGKSEVGRA